MNFFIFHPNIYACPSRMLIILRSTRHQIHINDVFQTRHLSGAVKNKLYMRNRFFIRTFRDLRLNDDVVLMIVKNGNGAKERESNWKRFIRQFSVFCCLSQSIIGFSSSLSHSCAFYSSLLFYRLKMFSCFCSFRFRLIA